MWRRPLWVSRAQRTAGNAIIVSFTSSSRGALQTRDRCDLWRFRLSGASTAEPFDGGAAGGKLVFQPLEATIEMIDAIDHGLAFGSQRSNHQRDGGTQIGRHDRRPFERVNSLNGGALATELDARAEPH